MAIAYLGNTISGVAGDTKPTLTSNEKGVIFIETDTNKIYQWDTDSWNEIVLSDASTSAKGIASFNSDNFAASSGVITIKNGGVILGTETTGNYVATVAGTANEVAVSASTGAVTISLPDDVTIGQDLVVTRNLTVSGTTVTANVNNLTIEDPLLYLANGQSSSPAFDSGFVVERGSSTNVAFIWDESLDEFAVANVPANEVGTTAGNVTINSYATLHAGIGKVTASAADSGIIFTVQSSGGLDRLVVSPNTSQGANYEFFALNGDTITLTSSFNQAYVARFVYPTYSGNYTITQAATVYIQGAAAVASSAVITANYAFWVDAGDVRFDGRVYLYDKGGEYIESDGGTLKLVGEATVIDSTGGNFTMRAAGGGMYLQSAENMFFDASQYFTWRDQDNSDNEVLKLNSATAAVTFEFQQEATISTSTGVLYIDGDDGLTLSTTAGGMTFNPTTNVHISNNKGLVIGHTAQLGFSDGMANSVTSEMQMVGTGTADGSVAIAAFSTGTAKSTAPLLILAKSASADFAAAAIVAAGTTLGAILFNGADGTNMIPTAASIEVVADGTIAENRMPGAMIFGTTNDAVGAQSTTERMRITSAGNVSIGNVANVGDTYPDSQLHVLKEDANYRTISDVLHLTHMTTGTATDGLATGLLFSTEVDAGHYIRAGARIAMVMTDVSNGSQNGDLVFETNNNNSDFAELNTYGTGALSASERMRITSAGNVGMGTSAPLAPLHVKQDNSDVNYAGAIIEQDGGGDASLTFYLTGAQNLTMGIDNSDGNKFKIANSDNVGSSEYLTIDTSGNMGIGTTVPDGRLHVHAATAGTVTASDKSSLVVEGSGTTHVAISILGPATAEKVLYFGEPDEDNGGNGEIRGWIGYNGHDDSPSNALTFGIQATPRLLFGTLGTTFAFQQATTISSIGALTLDPTTTLDFIVTANRNQTLRINDGTTNLYAIDSRNTEPALITHYYDSPNMVLADAANAVHQLFEFGTYNVTLAGQTTVSSSQRSVNMEATQILQTGGAVTVTEAVSFRIAGAPYGATDVTITNPLAFLVDAGKSRFDGDIDYYGSLNSLSDERLKANIQTIPSALSKVSQMRGVSFNRRYDNKDSGVGVLAQEMELIAPEVVSSGLGSVLINEGEADEELITNVKGVNYSSLIAYLIEAIKELKGEIDELKSS